LPILLLLNNGEGFRPDFVVAIVCQHWNTIKNLAHFVLIEQWGRSSTRFCCSHSVQTLKYH
jgi:hypothetical protein